MLKLAHGPGATLQQGIILLHGSCGSAAGLITPHWSCRAAGISHGLSLEAQQMGLGGGTNDSCPLQPGLAESSGCTGQCLPCVLWRVPSSWLGTVSALPGNLILPLGVEVGELKL